MAWGCPPSLIDMAWPYRQNLQIRVAHKPHPCARHTGTWQCPLALRWLLCLCKTLQHNRAAQRNLPKRPVSTMASTCLLTLPPPPGAATLLRDLPPHLFARANKCGQVTARILVHNLMAMGSTPHAHLHFFLACPLPIWRRLG